MDYHSAVLNTYRNGLSRPEVKPYMLFRTQVEWQILDEAKSVSQLRQRRAKSIPITRMLEHTKQTPSRLTARKLQVVGREADQPG